MYNILDKDRYDEMYKIMEDNFPPDERRSYEGQKALMDEIGYCVYTVEDEGEIKAFFAVWFLDGFVFGEHLAVDKKYQNKGIGTDLIKRVLNSLGVPMVLEIELEDSSDMAKRRASLYRRLGFNINTYEYSQPSYGEGKSEIPMHLVSYPDALDKDEFVKYKKAIYKEIYKMEI